MKKKVLLLSIIFLCFILAALLAYFFMYYLPDSSNLHGDPDFFSNPEFTDKIYQSTLDLGKFFLTLISAIFVASITFSEKIVNFNSSSWWSKSLLVACWILLLLSIASDGVGLVFLTQWYGFKLINSPFPDMGFDAFICFGLAGVFFGLALTSMLTAGIISFIK